MTYTHDDLDATLPAELLHAPDGPEPGSLLDRLRAQRAATKPDHLDVVIPGWGAETGGVEIVARFRRIPWRGKASATLKRLQSQQVSDDQSIAVASDLLIEGLDQLYARVDDRVQPLGEREPLRFDVVTAEALGLPAKTAREVVHAVFGGEVGEFALMAAAARYLQWLQAFEVVTEEEGNA